MTECTSIAKWIRRNKWVELDGPGHEEVRIRDSYNLGVDELEALGHEALHVAAEWRKEIAERVPTPPTHKVFTFSYYGSDTKIATWIERPWALVRIGEGTTRRSVNHPGGALMLIPPTKIACAQCGAETDYYHDVPEEAVCCSQCCCILAGCCDDCEGECRGMAWPEGYPPSLQ